MNNSVDLDLAAEARELRGEIQKLSERLAALERRLPEEHSQPGNESSGYKSAYVVPVDDEGSGAQVEVEDVKPVKLTDSAWSLFAVVGLTDAGAMDVAFSVVLLAANITMQALFIYILCNKYFLGDPFTKNVVDAKVWRTSLAHEWNHMDLAQTSLVTRICDEDGSMIVSSVQAKLLQDINKFLGLEKPSFDAPVWRPGVQLSLLCIVLWNLCVFRELRNIWLCLQAVVQLPRGRKTDFKGGVFRQISFFRLSFLIAAQFARFGLAVALLVSGTQWLARTTSIVDLILNAVALNGILDIDEFLFEAMVPTKIQLAIQNLEPINIKYQRWKSQMESVVFFTFFVTCILLPYFLFLQPLSDAMVLVKQEMCGGIQNFVVAFNPDVGMTYGLITRQKRNQNEPTIAEVSVADFKFRGITHIPKFIQMTPSSLEFGSGRIRSMATEAEYFPVCWEQDVVSPSGVSYEDDVLQPIAQSRLRTAAFHHGRPGNSTCQDLADLCQHPRAKLVRLMCGETCGCTDPLSTPWYMQKQGGCAEMCLEQRSATAWTLPCQDLATAQAWESWIGFWDNYTAAITAYWGAERLEYSNMANTTIEVMKTQGCQELVNQPTDWITGEIWCFGATDLFGPLAFLCPESCGCRTAPPGSDLADICPTSCTAPR